MTSFDRLPTSSWLPPFEESLVERGRELMLRNGSLFVVGQPGSGRLTLAHRIRGNGPVLAHRGSLAGSSTPYYALRRLDPSVDVCDRTPAEIALELARRRSDDREPTTVLLIGVDLCDHASLSTLIEHASTGAIHLIGTIRPAALAHHRLLGTAPTIELPALDHAGITRLLRIRYGEPDPVAVEFVHARSQGAYEAVVSVTESAVELGLLAVIDETLTLMPRPGEPPGLPPLELSPSSFHLHELLEFSPELTDLLHIVALVDEADVHELLAALPDAPLDLVLSHGVLQVVDDIVTFVIDAEAAAVAESLTLPRRADLHDRYSALFPRTFERPRAAMRAALCRQKVRGHVEPELAVLGARQANLEGLYREAVTVTEPTSPENLTPAPMERAFALVELGETASLVALLEKIDPASLDENELTNFLLLRWAHLPRRSDEDRDVLVGDEECLRRRSAVLRLASLWATSFRRSSPELEAEIRALVFSGALSPLNTATGYLALSTCQRNGGRPAQAAESARTALDMLVKNPAANAYVLEPAHEILIVALLDVLDFAAAEKVLIEYSSRPAPHGRTARMGHALWGMLEFRRGRVELALTHAQICLTALYDNDPQEISGWVRATTAELLAQHGKIDAVEAMLCEQDLRPTSRRLQHDLERRTAEASAYDAVGRIDEALTLLQGVITEARATGLRKAEIDAAAALVQIGGRALLPDLQRAVADLTDPSGVPEVWCRFVAAVEAEDMTELFLLVAHLADLKAAQLAAEVARFTLDFASSSGRDLTLGERLLLQHVAYRESDPVSNV